MEEWQPTHEVRLATGERFNVMVYTDDPSDEYSCAYTFEEWNLELPADFTVDNRTGHWFFQGEAFAGFVEKGE